MMKKYNLLDTHIKLIDSVNMASTFEEREKEYAFLSGWRRGIQDAGGFFSIQEINGHYANLGIKRPNIAGVWLDWQPEA